MLKQRVPDSPATLTGLPSFGNPPKIYGSHHTHPSDHLPAASNLGNPAGDEFTFAVPIASNDIFSGGLSLTDSSTDVTEKPKRLRLRQFLIQEREFVPSPSKRDELEGVSPGTYCLWSAGGKPGSAGGLPDQVEETCSTEWLFRRLIRDVLHGSRLSRGKERIVFVTPEKKRSLREGEEDGEGKLIRNGFVDRRPAAELQPEWSCTWQECSCNPAGTLKPPILKFCRQS